MISATETPKSTRASADLEHRRRGKLLWLELLVGVIVAVVGLEFLFAACGVGGQEFLEPDPDLGTRHIAGKLVTWRLEGYSNDKLSSAGLRDVEHSLAKPPGVTRIALIGDSSTEGLQVPLKDTYARILERTLNEGGRGKFEVLNFACAGYSTGQELIQCRREVVRYRPDITILLYNRGDSIENVRDPAKRNVEPRPYFYLDGKGNLTLDDAVLKARRPESGPIMDFLRRNSRIYGVFSQTNLALSINEPLYRKLRSWTFKLLSAFNRAEKLRATPLLYPRQDAWAVTSKLIDNLEQALRDNGSRLVLAVFPNTVGDPELAQQTEKLKKKSHTQHFDYLDLTGAFKAHPDPNRLFLKYHFSADGHALVAEELARYLTRRETSTALRPSPN